VRIGIFGGDRADGPVDRLIEEARATAAAGFASYWIPQIFGMDALTVLAVIGREVPDLELGTAVVPTYPRHPIMLAQQALTVQSITGGRLTLGIGLSHQVVIEAMYGLSFDKPVRHLREYLDALLPLLAGEAADAEGETITARAALSVRGATPVRTVVAALGPQMLALAGARTDGTATWMTGPATLAGHVIPVISAAAAAASRADFSRRRRTTIALLEAPAPPFSDGDGDVDARGVGRATGVRQHPTPSISFAHSGLRKGRTRPSPGSSSVHDDRRSGPRRAS